MRALMIIVDGMADRPIRKLGWKTPLEVADTPNMDHIAEMGSCGVFDPLGPGKRAGTDTATLAILGYDPYKYYTGRGALEAAGAGIKLQPGDIAFRCNFATVDENWRLINRTAGYINDGTDELERAINECIKLPDPDVDFIFKVSAGYRAALVFRRNAGNGALSPAVSDVYCEKCGVPVPPARPLEDSEGARKCAEFVNHFIRMAREVLREHPVNRERASRGLPPANFILVRGGSSCPSLESFENKWGLRGACIAGIGLIKGIAALTGMNVINVKGATGYIDSDFMAKGKAALDALRHYQFVIIHIEATDEVSHDGDFEKKIEVLERVDKMIGMLLDRVPEDTLFVLLSDHTTSSELGDHTADPAPIAIAGPTVLSDHVRRFTEREVYLGRLGRINALDIMPIILDYLNLSSKFGA
ncbi:MAG: 2,3-bisphosphoglycerate-independent phosphoglycerate mutase [Candidatus Baldrarchaeia archaeon]